MIVIAVVMFGMLIMPVSAITQLSKTVQIGGYNSINVATNVHNGGTGSQSVFASQSGNYNRQVIVNYNYGSISRIQTGNYQTYVNMNRMG